jgi:hypothetical protein
MPDRKPWICPQCGRGLPEWESSCDHGKTAAMEAAKVPPTYNPWSSVSNVHVGPPPGTIAYKPYYDPNNKGEA